jgi:hypothetical protein
LANERARGIAQILRTGWYSLVHVKSMHNHRLRALLATRKAEGPLHRLRDPEFHLT